MKIGLIIIALLIFWPNLILAKFDSLNKIGEGQVYYLGFLKVYDATLYVDNSTSSSNILDENLSSVILDMVQFSPWMIQRRAP